MDCDSPYQHGCLYRLASFLHNSGSQCLWMKLATICGICLAVSETISMLEGAEHFARLGKIRTGYAGCAFRLVSPMWIFWIATHNEETGFFIKQ